jgi:CheY-like chemotaxis protein
MSKILVAEDNLPNRELIREILESLGHEVTEAEDGQQALDRVKQAKPDLVLLDIQMPVLDGYAVVHELRQTPSYKELTILALTAYAMQGDREKALQSGFDGYLTKPVDIKRLKEELEKFLSRVAQVPRKRKVETKNCLAKKAT